MENNRFDGEKFENENTAESDEIDKTENYVTNEIELKDDMKIDVIDESGEDAGINIALGTGAALAEGKPFNLLKEIREWVVAILLALIVVGLIKGFVFDCVYVSGESMQTTLMNADRLILTKLGYTPKEGDIIVLDAHYKARENYIARQKEMYKDSFVAFDEFKLRYLPWVQKRFGIEPLHYVKRVIANEGDVIDIDEMTDTVYVNGKAIEEPYLDEFISTYQGREVEFPHTVEAGCVFVMGDNRENSRDSRFAEPGDVPFDAVMGKAVFRFWPISSFGFIN